MDDFIDKLDDYATDIYVERSELEKEIWELGERINKLKRMAQKLRRAEVIIEELIAELRDKNWSLVKPDNVFETTENSPEDE